MTKTEYEILIVLAMFPLTDTSLVEEAVREKSLMEFLKEPGIDVNMEQLNAVHRLLVFFDENTPEQDDWRMVVSSNVNSLSYDHAEGALLVKFHSGTIYSYAEVPHNIYKALCEAKSVGKAMNQIKQTYKATKIN